jgi:hypothetical protein
MLKKRNAAGLAMNIIVIAVIGLIILVILITIFSEKSRETVETFGSCIAKGGKCGPAADCSDGTVISEVKCEGGGVCCVKI